MATVPGLDSPGSGVRGPEDAPGGDSQVLCVGRRENDVIEARQAVPSRAARCQKQGESRRESRELRPHLCNAYNTLYPNTRQPLNN